MKIMMNVLEKPCVSIAEASRIISLSPSTIKRKINSGVIKCVERDNLREKILIYTDSLAKFLEEGDE